LIAGFIVLCLFIATVGADNRQSLDLCSLVISDNLRELRQQVRKSKIKKAKLLTMVDCSSNSRFQGGDLLRLAISFGSWQTANYLINTQGHRALTKVGVDGMTPLQWGKYYYGDNAASEAILGQLELAISK
jgi:hypothetical protein